MSDGLDRRQFLRAAAAAGVGLSLGAERVEAAPPPHSAAPALPLVAPPLGTVRIGFVGVGHQGTSHVQNFSRIEGVEIRAICDLLPEHVARAAKIVTDAGRPAPQGYSGGALEYRRMVERDDLDLVFTATPWELHAPVLLAAMNAGKHAATEVPMALTLGELWSLVETAERTGRHCVMMENCCYDRTEMMVLNMVRQGLLGEPLHAECGYLHDLRALKLTDYYVNRWRIQHSIRSNGDHYPTHGLGPVAQWMEVTRGNRFDTLVSTSTKSRGLNLWAAEHLGPRSAEARQVYALGDVVNSLIRTRRGETILVTHSTSSPRPYSRKVELQGTRGIVRKYPEERIYVEGRSPAERWEALASYQSEWEHPIWKALEERSRGAGHGGMDFIEDYRLVQCLRDGTPTDMDVYDGATVSSVVMLSERSLREGGRPVEFPDFTRGAWATRPPLGVIQLGGGT